MTHQKLKQKIITANLGNGEYLGKKIGLVDVLIAINEKKQECCCNKKNTMFLSPDFYVLMEFWDLTKDLNGQSEKCLEFLEDILLNK